MDLSESEARERFTASRSAVLATVDADARPHLVPVTFIAVEDHVYIAIDDKPKRTADPLRLKRLRNIAGNPAVSLLAEHYDDDWSQLWWVRGDGRAEITDPRPELVAALQERYPFYRDHPPSGPVIDVLVGKWSGWAFSRP